MAGPWIEKSRFLWYIMVKPLESLMILEVRDHQCFKVSTVCSNTAKQELGLEDVAGVMAGGLLLLIARRQAPTTDANREVFRLLRDPRMGTKKAGCRENI
jgi:hypothetical protein